MHLKITLGKIMVKHSFLEKEYAFIIAFAVKPALKEAVSSYTSTLKRRSVTPHRQVCLCPGPDVDDVTVMSIQSTGEHTEI